MSPAFDPPFPVLTADAPALDGIRRPDAPVVHRLTCGEGPQLWLLRSPLPERLFELVLLVDVDTQIPVELLQLSQKLGALSVVSFGQIAQGVHGQFVVELDVGFVRLVFEGFVTVHGFVFFDGHGKPPFAHRQSIRRAIGVGCSRLGGV